MTICCVYKSDWSECLTYIYFFDKNTLCMDVFDKHTTKLEVNNKQFKMCYYFTFSFFFLWNVEEMYLWIFCCIC